MADAEIKITVDIEPFRRALVLFRWRELRPFARNLRQKSGKKRVPRPGWAERHREMRLHPLVKIHGTGKADVLMSENDLTEEVKDLERRHWLHEPGVDWKAEMKRALQ